MKKPLLKLMMLCLLTCFTMVNAQDYKTMMDDPNYNVYDVIQKGNAYFKNRDKGKGSTDTNGGGATTQTRSG